MSCTHLVRDFGTSGLEIQKEGREGTLGSIFVVWRTLPFLVFRGSFSGECRRRATRAEEASILPTKSVGKIQSARTSTDKVFRVR